VKISFLSIHPLIETSNITRTKMFHKIETIFSTTLDKNSPETLYLLVVSRYEADVYRFQIPNINNSIVFDFDLLECSDIFSHFEHCSFRAASLVIFSV